MAYLPIVSRPITLLSINVAKNRARELDQLDIRDESTRAARSRTIEDSELRLEAEEEFKVYSAWDGQQKFLSHDKEAAGDQP